MKHNRVGIELQSIFLNKTMENLNKTKKEADQLYLRGEYQEAKDKYVHVLSKKKRRNTLKYIDIKKCIVDCQMHLNSK